jgi:hypothetical protein
VSEGEGATPERRPAGARGDDTVELFVNVGKREGLDAAALQRLLTGKGVAEDEVRRINVRDRMSYVTVKKGSYERAVAALNGEVVGGRSVVAEVARARR